MKAESPANKSEGRRRASSQIIHNLEEYKEQPAKVKAAAIGGSTTFDTICRLVLNIISLCLFLIFIFYISGQYRT